MITKRTLVTRPTVKGEIVAEMFKHIDDHMDVENKQKLDSVILRETLIVLAEWYFKKHPEREVTPENWEVSKDGTGSIVDRSLSFLDALDEIG